MEEPLDALIKLLDEWECMKTIRWIDDDGRLERWLVRISESMRINERDKERMAPKI